MGVENGRVPIPHWIQHKLQKRRSHMSSYDAVIKSCLLKEYVALKEYAVVTGEWQDRREVN